LQVRQAVLVQAGGQCVSRIAELGCEPGSRCEIRKAGRLDHASRGQSWEV